MDGLTFYKLINILKPKLINAKLNTLTIEKDSVFLSFYSNGMLNLEYRAAPAPPVLKKVVNIIGESPGALSAIHGSVVTDINTFSYERACYIEVKKRKPSGKLLTYKLILEPAGNYANFFLLSGDDIILYSLSSRTIDADRNIGAGGKYSLPKANKKYTLIHHNGVVSFNELSGFYPVTAKYADMLLKNYSFDEACALIQDNLQDDKFYVDEKGKVIPFYIDNAKVISYEELGDYFCVKENKSLSKDISRKIKKLYTLKRDKYLELAAKLASELNSAKKYQDILDEAELIKNNLYKVKGAGKYIFEQYSQEGINEIEYNVEQGEDLQQKSDKLFKKASRLKKSIPLIEERLQDTMQLALFSEEQIFYAETLSEEELAEFEKILDDENKNKNKSKKKEQLKPFLEYLGNGFRLYVGKNSASNHELVFKFAQSDDIWFHARNIPSAHGIIRLEGAELNSEIIEFAAKTVAYYSKYNSESLVDVDYTYKKYVTKPKNTPAGFVIYKRFKTVTVKPFTKQEISDFGLLKENNS